MPNVDVADARHKVAGDRHNVVSEAVLEFALPLLQAESGRVSKQRKQWLWFRIGA